MSAADVAYRLHRQFGESAFTWEQRLSHDFKRVALMVGTMRAMGAHDLLTDRMMPVEVALGAMEVQPKAEHRECLTDAEEDALQALYRDNPCEQTARALLRKRAQMRQASMDHDREVAERWGITL